MGLITVRSIEVKPECIEDFEDAVHRVARKAADDDDASRWSCREVVAGDLGTYSFVGASEDWAVQSRIEPADALVRRLFGRADGTELLRRLRASTRSARLVVARDRPDLSYTEGLEPGQPIPLAVVTRIQVRPGRLEACEELLRKLAEAIPKADDPRRFVTYQTLIGDLAQVATVIPLEDVASLDDILPPDELLMKAFGNAEGGLVFRNGLESMERAERHLTALRTDLSHPG
jgi:quinol monooxygenase YgiN